MNIMIPLGAFLENAVGPLAVRVMSALGLGVISFSALNFAVEAAIYYAQSQYSGLPSVIANLLGLAGIGECLGIIAAAITFRITLQTQRKVIGVLNK